MTSIISFPGLGIGEFTINSVAFSVFGHDITWYGIIVTSGIVAGFLYALYRAKFEKIKTDDVLDFAIYGVIFSIIGARLYYVLTTLENYHSFYDVIAIWNGGLAIYGGIIAGCITGFVICRIKKIRTAKLFDIAGPAFMLGQFIGRWGNFMNAEAFGSECSLPWRMGIQNIYHIDTIYVHPTFLYESLWNLLGFVLVNFFYKKKKYDGQIFLMYITWYGFGRMLIEGLRTDSLWVGSWRISQVVGLLSFVVGLTLLIVLGIRAKTHPEMHAKKAYYGKKKKKAVAAVSAGSEAEAPESDVDAAPTDAVSGDTSEETGGESEETGGVSEAEEEKTESPDADEAPESGEKQEKEDKSNE